VPAPAARGGSGLASGTQVRVYRRWVTVDATPPPDWVPDACVLPSAERPLRLAEFDDLFAAALLSSQRAGPHRLRLTLAGPSGLAAAVRDLTARESECCRFFTFTVDAPTAGRVDLTIEVPPARVAVLDALAERAVNSRGTR
jgi:hypothetical protein